MVNNNLMGLNNFVGVSRFVTDTKDLFLRRGAFDFVLLASLALLSIVISP